MRFIIEREQNRYMAGDFVRFIFESENSGFVPTTIINTAIMVIISITTPIINTIMNISLLPCEFVIFLMEHNTTGLMP